MKRAKLNPDEVLYVVVGSTMTAPDEPFTDEDGMHFYINAEGIVTTPVADDERGNFLPRYAHNSIVIIIEGGYTDDGIPSATSYYRNQLMSVEAISKMMLRKYPNAALTMWHQLKKGINPVLTPEDINRG
jgi:hypothetical protein